LQHIEPDAPRQYRESLHPERDQLKQALAEPPDGASVVESLIYQCETIKIDGLKVSVSTISQ
jgi:hypothetical protein